MSFVFFYGPNNTSSAEYVIDMNMVESKAEERSNQPTPSFWYIGTRVQKTAAGTQNQEIQKVSLPPAVQIYAPYYSQAPDGRRELPRSMFCSEANLVLAAYAISGKPLSKEQFKQEMLAMIPIQEKSFGTYFSIPMRDLKSVYDTMYPEIGNARILDNPTLEDMKAQLARGSVIIAPTAGRLLDNPFFYWQWPRFHTILIIWYDETHFYVNEVGMTGWENYRYTHETVMHAMHDFVAQGDITQWKKLVMVIDR